VRRVLRRRASRISGPGVSRGAGAAIFGILLAALGARPAADRALPSLHITSPLGRTGLPGTIRIVARLEGTQTLGHEPAAVRFYVDKLLLASDTDGPPYDAVWTDDNPFERRELMVQAEFATGETLTDTVVLNPLQMTEATEITSVAIEASVLDDKGHFVRDLAASDFEVFEDAQPQELNLFSQKREPALFALLVDSSQSMAMRADVLRATAARLLSVLAADDEVVIAPFSRHIVSVTGPTIDRTTAMDAIAAIKPAGGTAILDVLQEVAVKLAGQQRRRAIVLITDGYDEHSISKFDATVDALRNSGVTVYVIGMGGVAGVSLKGEAALSQLAKETGGYAWFPRDERRIPHVYEAIATDVQHRYFLTYTPTNQRRDGTWRPITVTTRTPGLSVRARNGYTAPIAPPVRAMLEFTAVGRGQVPVSLTRDDLVVLEDGVAQKLDTFHEAVLPVTIMLALDASGSMKNSAGQAQEAAREFVAAMRPEDLIGLIMFADKSQYIHSPTERRDWSLNAIDQYKAEGGTALYDALYDSLAQIADVSGRRVVVVVTDGRDENAKSNGPGSLRTWDEVLRKLRQTEAAVYAVGVGSRVDRERLQQLADQSGGATYFPSDVTTLAADYHKILDELRRRYVIGYESTNRKRNGAWRKVELGARAEGVSFRSRGGYFPPPQ
jgi:Ca-activated chloride channel family protein